jgi:hypothetical protein
MMIDQLAKTNPSNDLFGEQVIERTIDLDTQQCQCVSSLLEIV